MVTSYLIAVSTTVYISLPREVVSTESQFFYKTAKRLKLTVIVLTELQKYQEKNDSCSCTGRPEGTEAFSWRNSDEKTEDGGEKITEIRGMPRKENHIWQLCNFLRSLNGANHSCSPVMVNTMTANNPILIKAPLQGFVWHPRLRHDFAPGAIPKVINFITFISKWRGKAFWCPGTSSNYPQNTRARINNQAWKTQIC